MQSAKALHDVLPWPHPQMESVAQNDLRAHVFQAARHHALDRAVGAHRHENRGLNHAVVQTQLATAGVAQGVGAKQFKFKHGVFYETV